MNTQQTIVIFALVALGVLVTGLIAVPVIEEADAQQCTTKGGTVPPGQQPICKGKGQGLTQVPAEGGG